MAKKRPNLVQNLHFWSFWAKYCHFLHILSNARPKNNVNKVPRWVFRYVGNKTFDFSSKKRIFCSKTTKFSPKLAFLTIAGLFGALLMGWLVVVAHGLYLARHLFTLLLSRNLTNCPSLNVGEIVDAITTSTSKSKSEINHTKDGFMQNNRLVKHLDVEVWGRCGRRY